MAIEWARRHRRGGNRGGGRRFGAGNFILAVEVIHLGEAEETTGRAQSPFVGVGIIKCIERRIVRDDHYLEVDRARVDQLMRLVRRMDKNVAGLHAMGRRAGAHAAFTGMHDEELPLPEV